VIRISPRLTVLTLLCATFSGLASAKSNTTTTLASSLNPSTYGSSVKLTATVSPSAATGTVTFKDGSTTLGTGTLSSGTAMFTTSTLTAGAHSIMASYGGNSAYNTSTSSALSQTVNKASSTTTLASSANPSTYGSSVKFTATVTSGATGTVTFKDGSTTLGTGTLSSGKATFATSSLTAGSHSVTASYGGDTNFNGSASSALSQTVNKANTSTTVGSSSNPSAYGSSVTFTATISSTTATGTVTFKDGTTTLGTGTVSSGVATYTTSSLAIGSHSITAVYSGDSNYNTSTSSKLTQTVEQTSSTTVSSSTNPAPANAPITFTAAVSPSAATGTVTFMSGSTTLGTGTLSTGVASFSTSSLASGTYSITTVYGGSSTYVGSISPVLSQSVLALSSISVTPQSPSVPIGATQQLVATGTFSNGTTGNITASATWTSSATNVATVSSAGVATAVNEGQTTIQAAVGTINASASLTGTPSSFRLTGSLSTARVSHTETVLQNGQVLIVGGQGNDGANILGSCELYNPITGTFSATGNLNVPRFGHTATLLNSGMVLIVGGGVSDGMGDTTETAIAELYNPATGVFTLTGNLTTAVSDNTSTLLTNGMVLIAGGGNVNGDLATAQLYDPTAGTFANTGTLNIPRAGHTATLLNDGTVLIAGGEGYSNGVFSSLAIAEIYNPTTGSFSTTGSLNTARNTHTATVLNTGNVLIAGGYSGEFTGVLAGAELYNPTTKLFSAIGNMTTPRVSFTATLLTTGNVLLVGGANNNNQILGTGELYNPTTGAFSLAGNLNEARGAQTAGLLNNGTVLLAAGGDHLDLSSAEIYDSTAPPPPFSLQITPAASNLAVGGTQTFTAVDNVGIPRQDVNWTVSNTSLASLVSNPNGTTTVTGLAAGVVNLTATAEGVTAQAQVTILASGAFVPGTVIWSAPAMPGFSLQKLVQAVPSSTGPDLYATQISADGTQSIIQALQADGEQLWQAQIPPLMNNTAVPDGFGGLIVTTCASGSPMTIIDFNATGEPLWQVAAAEVNGAGYVCYPAPIAVRGDGVVFITEPTNAGLPSLTEAFTNGGIKSFQFPPSIVNSTTQVPCCVGPPMVNTDGTVYVEYEVRNTYENVITSDTLYLYSTTTGINGPVLSSTTQNEALLPGPIIPDGNGGVLATWTISPARGPVPLYPYQAADVTNSVVGTPYNLPFSPASVTPFVSPTLVLGENGVAFASGQTTASDGVTQVSQIASFNIASGFVNWTYQAGTQYTLSIVAAAHGNGVTAKLTQSGEDTVVRLDSNGNPTYDSWASGPASGVDFFVSGDAWIGNVSGSGAYGVISATPIPLSTSGWYRPDGNSGKTAKSDFIVTGFSQGPDANYSAITSSLQAIQAALPSYASCNNWLQGTAGTSGLQEIQNLLNPKSGLGYGHGTVNLGTTASYATAYTIAAFSGASNSDGTAVQGLPTSGGVIMTVNDAGAFFNQSFSNAGTTYSFLVGIPKYAGNSAQARATILIHELAHQIEASGFQPDGNDPKGQLHKANDLLVNQNCSVLIAAQ
jgi:hypothetical protein